MTTVLWIVGVPGSGVATEINKLQAPVLDLGSYTICDERHGWQTDCSALERTLAAVSGDAVLVLRGTSDNMDEVALALETHALSVVLVLKPNYDTWVHTHKRRAAMHASGATFDYELLGSLSEELVTYSAEKFEEYFSEFEASLPEITTRIITDYRILGDYINVE
jgi:hypothetical protein